MALVVENVLCKFNIQYIASDSMWRVMVVWTESSKYILNCITIVNSETHNTKTLILKDGFFR